MSFSSTTPVVTTDATPTLIPLQPVQVDSGVQLQGYVVAMSSTGAMRSWNVIRNGRRLGASPAEIIGAGVTVLNETTAGFNPTITIVLSNNVPHVQCTGIAATTIRWSVSCNYFEVLKP